MLQQDVSSFAEHHTVQTRLDDFYMSRIGIRMVGTIAIVNYFYVTIRVFLMCPRQICPLSRKRRHFLAKFVLIVDKLVQKNQEHSNFFSLILTPTLKLIRTIPITIFS